MTLPPLGLALPEELPDDSLAIEDVRDVLCRVDVANMLPDVGSFDDPGAVGEVELGERELIDVVGAALELLSCRLSAA